MYLTKLSRKYHLLNKERKEKGENNSKSENICNKDADNQASQVNREAHRPSPDVIVISTTSSRWEA